MHPLKEMAMRKAKIESFKYNVNRALTGKLKTNFSICGFYIICPKANSHVYTITFNTNSVATVEDGEMNVLKFNPKHWGSDTYKYDVLCNIEEEIHPEKADVEKTEPDGEKTATEPITEKSESETIDKRKDERTLVRATSSKSTKGKPAIRGRSNVKSRK